MEKSILYRWFGFGKIPKRYNSDMQKEGVLLQDEGLAIVLRYRNFRAPYVYYGKRISLVMGSIVLSKSSFACFRGNIIPPIFHVPVTSKSFQAFDFSLDEKARLHIVIDAPTFKEGWKGTIDCRIPCENAEEFLQALTAIKSQKKESFI